MGRRIFRIGVNVGAPSFGELYLFETVSMRVQSVNCMEFRYCVSSGDVCGKNELAGN